ncbi:hypothetical protein BS47DRAFT_1360744 [Hydnum rufescens UP504]|uniref:Uncharacterized protein n=1 Tax=Hydnum rufescens UP504 TaxID=1448309 RepID=A0A9P6B156_9AGAM|nr:hypothetical protein BS47DRAFT_1360744 [Hydnum rufescens UP504]
MLWRAREEGEGAGKDVIEVAWSNGSCRRVYRARKVVQIFLVLNPGLEILRLEICAVGYRYTGAFYMEAGGSMQALSRNCLDYKVGGTMGGWTVMRVVREFLLGERHHVQMDWMLSWVFYQPSFCGIEHLEIVDVVEELVLLPSLHLLPKLRMLEVIQSQIPTIGLGATTSVWHIYFEALVMPPLISTKAFYHLWRFLNGCRHLQSLQWVKIGMLDGMFLVDPGVPGDWSFSFDWLNMEIHSRTSCTAGLMLLLHTGLWVHELNILLGGRVVCDSEVLYWLASGEVTIVQEGGFHLVSELHGWRVRRDHMITAKANFLHHTVEQYEFCQRSGGYPSMLELGEIPGNIKTSGTEGCSELIWG